MFLIWPMLVFLGLGFFLIGTVVGSFLNVCIYRIPWQKSVIWPGSRCPRCYAAIAARDNIPIVSWIALRGECRSCGAPISVRYPLVEALVGLLFLGAYLVDVIAGPRGAWGQVPAFQLVAAAYHAVFLALAGRGHVHRLRPDDHPRPDHGDRHGRRDRAGYALAQSSTRAGVVAAP